MGRRNKITSNYYNQTINEIQTAQIDGFVNITYDSFRRKEVTSTEFVSTPDDYDGPMHEELPLLENNDYRQNKLTDIRLLVGNKCYQRNLSRSSLGASGVYRLSVVTKIEENVAPGLRINEDGKMYFRLTRTYETRTILSSGKLGDVFSSSSQYGLVEANIEKLKKASKEKYWNERVGYVTNPLGRNDLVVSPDMAGSGYKGLTFGDKKVLTGVAKSHVEAVVKFNDLHDTVQKDAMELAFYKKRFKDLHPEDFNVAQSDWYGNIMTRDSYHKSKRKTYIKNFRKEYFDKKNNKEK